MAEQPLAGPAPAPALVFTAREPSELLKQRYGKNEEFLEVPYLPPSLAGAFAGGYKDTEGNIGSGHVSAGIACYIAEYE